MQTAWFNLFVQMVQTSFLNKYKGKENKKNMLTNEIIKLAAYFETMRNMYASSTTEEGRARYRQFDMLMRTYDKEIKVRFSEEITG